MSKVKSAKPRYATIEKAIRTGIEKVLGKDSYYDEAIKHQFDGVWGDYRFYTPDQWAMRGESIGEGALLSMTFEGTIYEHLNYNGLEGYTFALMESINAELNKLGVYYEQGFAWSLHVYP